MTKPKSKQAELIRILNRLTKWRTVFASWQLGTRSDTDAECLAVKDHRELCILMRAETSALLGLLLKKGVFTTDEFSAQVAEEAEELNEMYARKFPGFIATDSGIDIDIEKAAETMRDWPP